MSATYSIKTVIRIPVSMDKAWDFFSRPDNLQLITPEHLGFKIISQHHGQQMYAGQIIEYKVKPLLGIPLYWMTEITQAVDRKYFIDEQRVGPYSMWHHQHHFQEIPGGVEMTDIVHYRLPLGFLGDIAHVLFVKRQLEHIFSYRTQRVESIFGQWINNTQ
jgi:ligand-binding SRPBCC domain-containing protein